MSGLTSSPHIHQATSVQKVMWSVVAAMVPGVAIMLYVFGWGTLIQIAIAVITALITESLMLAWRGKPLRPFVWDGSAVLTAMLLAVSLPPYLPWWLTVLGVVCAIAVVKHLYGGLGHNPFNPAMMAYVILLLAFPVPMTTLWALPQSLVEPLAFSQALDIILHSATGLPDGWSSATPLDFLRTSLATGDTTTQAFQSELLQAFFKPGWAWVNLAFLSGGLWLLWRRIITWHIPVLFLTALSLCTVIPYLLYPELFASPLFHLLSGGTMLGAFFIATDPVSAATSRRGRLYFAGGIGLLVFIIRAWGGYPDAIAFAVLLMNMSAASLDMLSKPTTYGREK